MIEKKLKYKKVDKKYDTPVMYKRNRNQKLRGNQKSIERDQGKWCITKFVVTGANRG